MNDNSDVNDRIAQTIRDFVTQQHAKIPVVEFLTNAVLAALLGAAMGWLYARYGTSFSNRRQFGKNFVLLAMATMLIISIVKSSLALSLGLVGALSIVRFRAAIKDPEELVFLFLTIALGLGLGASQTRVTLLGFAMVAAVIVTRGMLAAGAEPEDIAVTVAASKGAGADPAGLAALLKRHCSSVAFRRLEEDHEQMELAFTVSVRRFEDLVAARDAVSKADGVKRVLLLDTKGAAY